VPEQNFSPYPFGGCYSPYPGHTLLLRCGCQTAPTRRSANSLRPAIDGIDVQSCRRRILSDPARVSAVWRIRASSGPGALAGKPLVYEIDDLLLELPDVHPDRAIDYYTPAILPILHAIASADLSPPPPPTWRNISSATIQTYRSCLTILDDDFLEITPVFAW